MRTQKKRLPVMNTWGINGIKGSSAVSDALALALQPKQCAG